VCLIIIIVESIKLNNMYKLRYYSTFKDICNNTLRLEIYKDLEETVTAEELILSADAVSI
jgi:hypothetical protein